MFNLVWFRVYPRRNLFPIDHQQNLARKNAQNGHGRGVVTFFEFSPFMVSRCMLHFSRFCVYVGLGQLIGTGLSLRAMAQVQLKLNTQYPPYTGFPIKWIGAFRHFRRDILRILTGVSVLNSRSQVSGAVSIYMNYFLRGRCETNTLKSIEDSFPHGGWGRWWRKAMSERRWRLGSILRWSIQAHWAQASWFSRLAASPKSGQGYEGGPKT